MYYKIAGIIKDFNLACIEKVKGDLNEYEKRVVSFVTINHYLLKFFQ